jgi:hypothetical protein
MGRRVPGEMPNVGLKLTRVVVKSFALAKGMPPTVCSFTRCQAFGQRNNGAPLE